MTPYSLSRLLEESPAPPNGRDKPNSACAEPMPDSPGDSSDVPGAATLCATRSKMDGARPRRRVRPLRRVVRWPVKSDDKAAAPKLPTCGPARPKELLPELPVLLSELFTDEFEVEEVVEPSVELPSGCGTAHRRPASTLAATSMAGTVPAAAPVATASHEARLAAAAVVQRAPPRWPLPAADASPAAHRSSPTAATSAALAGVAGGGGGSADSSASALPPSATLASPSGGWWARLETRAGEEPGEDRMGRHRQGPGPRQGVDGRGRLRRV